MGQFSNILEVINKAHSRLPHRAPNYGHGLGMQMINIFVNNCHIENVSCDTAPVDQTEK